jgi:hypothetical protein
VVQVEVEMEELLQQALVLQEQLIVAVVVEAVRVEDQMVVMVV